MLARLQLAVVLAALIMSPGVVFAQSGLTNSTKELLEQGQDQMAAEEWTAAEATFRRALQSEPDNPAAHEGLGQSLYRSGKLQEALGSFKRVLELEPSNSATYYHFGCCHYRLGDFKQAAQSFQRYLVASPTNANGHYWLSDSLARSGRPAEAEAAIRKAIALGTAPARYYVQLGFCLSQQSKYKEAIAAHNQALSLDATNKYALLQLGFCYYQSSAYREAVVPLEKYVTLEPKDFDSYFYLGHSYVEMFQFDRAVPALQAAHELKPDDEFTRLGLSLSYLATSQYKKAYGLYPLIYMAGGSVLVFCYLIAQVWVLVMSFRQSGRLVQAATADQQAISIPPLLRNWQPLPPMLPGFISSPLAVVEAIQPPEVVSTGERPNAWPSVWFALAWLVLFIVGQVPCAFLVGLVTPLKGTAALILGIGVASLPVLVAACAGFSRQPWGAPFAWPRPFPSPKLCALSALGLVSVTLFEAGYSTLVEWITHRSFPVQIALPFLREAVRTNPVTAGISVVLLAPMAEEVLFRGLLFGAVQRWLSARWTILLTAATFALIHMQAIYFIPIFLLGLICGWARHRSGSVALPMALHVLNNACSLISMQLFPQST